jgi:hypothetical protein
MVAQRQVQTGCAPGDSRSVWEIFANAPTPQRVQEDSLNTLRSRLSYANVVASLALVLALGGASAFAATQLAKNSVGAKQLKKNAVTGAKVKNGSLSAADIGGAVNSAKQATSAASATTATSAQRAGDAERLGGLPASAFQAAGSGQRIDWNVSGCGAGPAICRTLLFSANGLSLQAYCAKGVSGEAGLEGAGPAGSTYWLDGSFGGASHLFEEFTLSPPLLILGFGDTNERFQGTLILRSPDHTATLQLGFHQDNAGGCKIVGTALST